jgi:DNA-binding transcriptional LysR family regulator
MPDPFSSPLRNLRSDQSLAGSALAQLLSRRAAGFVGFAGLKARKLIVAASQTVARYWLPSRLRAFQAANPGIEVNVRIANTERAAMDVREGAADLGFVEGEVDDGALSVRSVDADALVVVVGPRHPLAKQPKLSAGWMRRTPWILPEPGSDTRVMFELVLKKRGLRLSDLVQIELASNEAIRTAVESGVCATAISDLVVEKSIAAKTLFRVDGELAKRAFYAVRHTERHVSNAEAALLASIGTAT